MPAIYADAIAQSSTLKRSKHSYGRAHIYCEYLPYVYLSLRKESHHAGRKSNEISRLGKDENSFRLDNEGDINIDNPGEHNCASKKNSLFRTKIVRIFSAEFFLSFSHIPGTLSGRNRKDTLSTLVRQAKGY